MWRLIPILCFAFLLSCGSSSRPPEVLDEARFVGVYCDLLQESLRSRNTNAVSAAARANADSILGRSGVPRDVFEKTYKWYNEDVTRWKTFMEEVTHELERRETTPSLRR
jgi:hypothetical protein